jgi:competence ComEA-like helix-hairpin-helix protein
MAKQQKIDINAASQDELTRIPGVDAGLAAAIIEFRDSHGRIDDLEELEDMEPIQPEDVDNLRDWVTVGAEPEEEKEEEEEEEKEEEEEEW